MNGIRWLDISLLFTGLLFPSAINGFNIDTNNCVIFSGSAESFFGYSIVLAGNKLVITGAPRGNSSDLPRIDRPGAVYKCYTLAGSPNCQEIRIDGKFESDSALFDGKLLFFEHGRTGQWLGGSLQLKDTASGWEIVTCATRWYNRKFENDGEYDMNGLCYLIPADLQTANIRKLPAMVGATKRTAKTSWGQQVYNFAMAGMGLSVHVSKEVQNVLMGAPGLKYWTGGFVELDGQSVKYMESDVDNVNVTQDSYVGYAMSSGRYFSDRQIYYAIGAPRADLTGKVFMFRSDETSFLLEEADSVLTPWFGEDDGFIWINSYFGAVLCSEDVNADGNDDLLVGAPMLSKYPPEFDVGAVFLYLGTSRQEKRFQIPDVMVQGTGTVGARFGSAISSLGDINNDGFKDIIVGAPYEDGGRGAVYIYNGYENGLWPKYSQMILGRTIGDTLFGFGASLSNSMDMNRDNINDIAVGAYLSSKITLLFGQPVIQMEAWIEVVTDGTHAGRRGPAMIRRDTHEIFIKTCFRFTDSIDTQSVTLNVTLKLDSVFSGSPRLLFRSSNSNTRQLQVKVWRGDTTCTVPRENDTAFVQSTFDLVTPVVILSEYAASSMAFYGDGVEPTINRFTGSNPRDPQLEVTRELHFLKDCVDNICNTDLHISTDVDFESIDGFFIIGSQLLILHVNVTKDGEPSYGSVFILTFPWFLRYRKTEEISVNTDFSCTREISDSKSELGQVPDEKTLICHIGNPMYNDSGVEFLVYLQVPVQLTVSTMALHVNVGTLSNETNLTDNSQSHRIEAVNHVKGALSGIADPQTMFISKQTEYSTAQHVYEFANAGPSLLPRATVNYYIPDIKYLQGSQGLVYLNETKFEFNPTCEMNCTIHKPPSSAQPFVRFNGRLENYTQGQNASKYGDEECEVEQCPFLECSIFHLPARSTVVTSLIFAISKNAVKDKSQVLQSRTEVEIDENLVLSYRLRFEKSLATELLPQTPPKEEVEVWVIVMSVTIGIILLVILMLILFKLGFFRRQLRDELVRQKSVRSTMSQRNNKDGPEKQPNDVQQDDDKNDDCVKNETTKHLENSEIAHDSKESLV